MKVGVVGFDRLDGELRRLGYGSGLESGPAPCAPGTKMPYRTAIAPFRRDRFILAGLLRTLQQIFLWALFATTLLPPSLSAVSGPALLGADGGTGLCGRFGYSDLKEAALSGGRCSMGVELGLVVVVGRRQSFVEPLSELRAGRGRA